MDYWHTSDLHFDHRNIIKYQDRPFLNAEEQILFNNNELKYISRESVDLMNETLLDNINQCVKPNDTLRILGDFYYGKCGKKRYCERTKYFRDRIHCKNVHLIFGNHDRPKLISSLFSSAQYYCELNINGINVIEFHYPILSWRSMHHKSIHFYGHSHSNLEPWFQKFLPERRSIDVGVDNAIKILGSLRPFAFEELIEIIKNKKGEVVDHHAEKLK